MLGAPEEETVAAGVVEVQEVRVAGKVAGPWVAVLVAVEAAMGAAEVNQALAESSAEMVAKEVDVSEVELEDVLELEDVSELEVELAMADLAMAEVEVRLEALVMVVVDSVEVVAVAGATEAEKEETEVGVEPLAAVVHEVAVMMVVAEAAVEKVAVASVMMEVADSAEYAATALEVAGEVGGKLAGVARRVELAVWVDIVEALTWEAGAMGSGVGVEAAEDVAAAVELLGRADRASAGAAVRDRVAAVKEVADPLVV